MVLRGLAMFRTSEWKGYARSVRKKQSSNFRFVSWHVLCANMGHGVGVSFCRSRPGPAGVGLLCGYSDANTSLLGRPAEEAPPLWAWEGDPGHLYKGHCA